MSHQRWVRSQLKGPPTILIVLSSRFLQYYFHFCVIVFLSKVPTSVTSALGKVGDKLYHIIHFQKWWTCTILRPPVDARG